MRGLRRGSPGQADTDGDGAGDCSEAFDVNGNGLVNPADRTLVLQAFFGIITGDWAFDVNGNGQISAADSTLIAMGFAGIRACIRGRRMRTSGKRHARARNWH